MLVHIRKLADALLEETRKHLECFDVLLPVVFTLRKGQLPKHQVLRDPDDVSEVIKKMAVHADAVFVIMEILALDIEGLNLNALSRREDGSVDLSKEKDAEPIILAVIHRPRYSEIKMIRYRKAGEIFSYFDRGWSRATDLPIGLRNPWLEAT